MTNHRETREETEAVTDRGSRPGTREASVGDEPPRRPSRSLYRDRDYLMLWSGQAVNNVGDAVSSVALPLLAITLLHINALQAGSLRAAEQLTALFSVPLGVLVDRVRKRRLMIGTDLLRTSVTVLVPVAGLAGFLSFPLLIGVALVMGLLDSLFSIAYSSHLPDFLPERHRMQGTAQLGTGKFGALSGGYALGGVLVSVAGASRTLLLDSASYLVSALTLLAVRRPDPLPAPRTSGAVPRGSATGSAGLSATLAGWRQELGVGVQCLRADPQLGVLAVTMTWISFALALAAAVEMLFLVEDLHASSLGIGLVLGLPVLAGVPGSQLSVRLMRRFGPARVMRVAIVGYAPVVAAPALAPAGTVGLVVAGCGWAALILVAGVYNASNNVLRQQITPAAARGRVNASIRAMAASARLVALLIGGAVGTMLGLRCVMVVSALALVGPAVLLLSSSSFGSGPVVPVPQSRT
ncbi:MFS transporter [Streptacidiphilus sp. N1-10]|uniref:MFS transporter n=1 Tax=Streptacidiphilus jeojiensis TaxID=3229225 RepID=A0ABV6XUK9_9ACTN